MNKELEKRIRTGETILRNISNWFSARNKELWSGSWKEGDIAIPGIEKYNLIALRFSDGSVGLAYRNGAYFSGASNYPYNNGILTCTCNLVMDGSTLKMSQPLEKIKHNVSGNHSASLDIAITKITGIEPILPDVLSGGGAALKRLPATLRIFFKRRCAVC